MSLYDYISAINVAPLLLKENEVVVGESNASILAKVAWRYRVRPGCIAKYLMQNNRGTLGFLSRDVAVSFNSVTEKSAQIDEQLARITGLSGHCGSYSYLGAFLDRGARGLISEGKKWCARCYAESMEKKRSSDAARVSDQLYWSLSFATHCTVHFCSLSVACGKCFKKQPYVSSVVEPGFCHWCFASLANAPFFEPESDATRLSLKASFLKYDIFYPSLVKVKSDWTLNRLAQNLRGIIDLAGDLGFELVSNRCGVSEHTLRDWCRVRHAISLDSLVNLVEGLGLERASDLFLPFEFFYARVEQVFSGRLAFSGKKDCSSIIPKISEYLLSVLTGKVKAISRSEMASLFGVSKGMLEHGFKNELQKISEIYEAERLAESLKVKNRLQYEMNQAVRRCGAKGRRIDWPHIMTELQNVDLRHAKQRQLYEAKVKALELYRNSRRRHQGRNVDALIDES